MVIREFTLKNILLRSVDGNTGVFGTPIVGSSPTGEIMENILDKEEFDIVERCIYDAHNKTARDLVAWWERHKEWDKRRVAEENEEKRQSLLRKTAIDKLTAQEMKALGLLEKR